MTNVTHQENQSKPNEKTEAEMRAIDGHAGNGGASSKNAKSHTKAGQRIGAGGGKKQERYH